ncbi:lactate utilization protein LutB domain-containing protein [Bacillus sp. SL00103]
MYQFGTSGPSIDESYGFKRTDFKGIGPLKNWTDIRDLPAQVKERFRDWFKERQKEEQ